MMMMLLVRGPQEENHGSRQVREHGNIKKMQLELLGKWF